ncbi:MAG: hypothetical protein GY785_24050 [Gammaproteobacteria bacterium]|nr:hypothetical protein [Gammaproteobacteria bacterium]
MKFPSLFRRRSLVLPTLVGWAAILLVLGLIAVFVFRNIALYLTVNEPVGADYLVIEAWMYKEELDQAHDYFDANDYQFAILVGGPISNDFHEMDSNFAQRAADYLRLKGMPADKMVVLAPPHSAQNRTFLNAVFVRDWFLEQGGEVANIDVFTSPAHTRRSRELYQIALGESIEVGIVPSNPSDFDPAYWWRSSRLGKGVAVEFAGWLLVKCCFRPGDPGSHLERWGIEKTANGS